MRPIQIFFMAGFCCLAIPASVFAQNKQVLVNQTLDHLENRQASEAPGPSDDLQVKTAPATPALTPPAETVAAPGEISPANSLIDVVNFRDTDILDALQEIGRKSGLSIAVNDDVRGRVTLYVQNLNVWDLLKIVLEPNRLAYAKENGQVLVMRADEFRSRYGYNFNDKTQVRLVNLHYLDQEILVNRLMTLKSTDGKIIVDSKSRQLILMDALEKLVEMEDLIRRVDVPVESKTFALQFIQVKDVKEPIDKMLTELAGRAEYDVQKRRITVTDTEEKVQAAADLIRKSDKQVNVNVVAEVLQIRLTEEHGRGIDWEAIVSDYQKLELAGVNLAGKVDLSLGTITEEDYSVLLEALGTVGEVKHLGEIKTTAVANFLTELKLESSPGGEPPAEAQTQNGFEMLLKVKPNIETDRVMMELNPKLYWILDNRRTTGNWRMEIYGREDSLAVSVQSQDIIVIGGLIRETEVKRVNKVPLLGDLPIFGFAFRMQDKLIEKTEYVIFLKPKVGTEAPTTTLASP